MAKSKLQDVSEIKTEKKLTTEKCSRCDGEGKIHHPMYDKVDPKNEGKKLPGQPCPNCGGSGEVRVMK